jgi:diguanylate cyclase (GGDEF)-like protein
MVGSIVIRHEADILQRDCILAVDDSATLGAYLSHRYPDCQVRRASTLLSAIDELTRHSVRAVVARLDPEGPHLTDAVAGLREAAGARTKLLLCGPADAEPELSELATASADDYLLWPLSGRELDRALGFHKEPDHSDSAASATLEELALLGTTLAHLDEEPFALLTRLADLIRLGLGAESSMIIADGSVAQSGPTGGSHVLTEPLRQGGRVAGQVAVGHREKPYGAGDAAKLRHYATIAGNLLATTQRMRGWRHDALTDPVSGLRNRRYARTFLTDLLERARSERFRVTVLLFDIDNFKSYNDTYGHTAGDEIIRQVGALFKAHCREHDVVTRYGGDEFCVVFWDADSPRVAGSTHPSDALKVLSRFQEALRGHRCTAIDADHGIDADAGGSLTISGGLASFPWDASTTDDLIDRADQALLQAKRAGKNRVFVFGEDPLAAAPDAPAQA